MTGLEEENIRLRAKVDRLSKELQDRDQFISLLESQLKNLQLLRKESGVYSISDIPSVSSNTRSMIDRVEPPRRSIAPSKVGEKGLLESKVGIGLDFELIEGSEEGNSDPDGVNDKGQGAAFKMAKGAIKALPRELSIINSDSDDITKYSRSSGNFRLESAEMRDAYNARGIYSGEISRKVQMPHGRGRMNYHLQGRFYEGDWNMGHWHGFGIIRNAFGDYYRGQVVNDLKEGNGRLEHTDGRVFEGLFRSDDAVKGTLTFPDGARYVGELNDGKRHGAGIYYFGDGSRYEGQTVNNFFEGKGKMIWEDGGYYEGEWAQGEIDGYGKELHPNGSLRHEGLWRNGSPVRN